MSPDSSAPARFRLLIDSLFEQVGSAFRRAGWAVHREPSGGPPGYTADYLFERKGLRYVAELRIAREARRPELPALLADAFIRAQVGAKAHHGRPLAMVGAPAISDEWVVELADHAKRFFRGAAWGLIDGRGRLEVHGPGLEELRREPQRVSGRSARPESRPDLFSDRGQWMAKVLLAPSLPEGLLRAPRERIGGPSQLAHLAGVSVPSASRFLSRLDEFHHLERGDGVRLVRRAQFLADWRRVAGFVRDDKPCRWLLPGGDSLDQLVEALRENAKPTVPRSNRACLGLFAACERLGLGFVRGAPVHLYLERASDPALELLGLAPASRGEAVDVFVREPKFPEAVFRAAVPRDGVLVADVLQCWLDVADHPVRGAEQAEQLWRRVIEPQIVEGLA
jgi:hypothetical protein